MASALKDYLQRYASTGAETEKAKSKSKKKRKGRAAVPVGGVGNAGNGFVIVDDDAVWQKEGKPEDEDEPDEEADMPTVIEDVEVKRMHRMEALKTHRPYLSMSDDGSGWVKVRDDEPDGAAPGGSDNSASRSPRGKSPEFPAKRKRNDSPDLSPPRRRNDSPDMAPGRRVNSDDLSPPMRSRISTGAPKQESRDLSPPRKRRDSPDLSPPRRRHDSPLVSSPRRGASDDLSPPRKSKFSSAPRNVNQPQDLSPPRKRRDSPDLSPPRRRHDSPLVSSPRRGASDDLSPPRKSIFSTAPRNLNQPQDCSPPRKRRDTQDLSPPRRRRRDSPETSAVRGVVSGDSSPPRRSKFSTGAPGQTEARESSFTRKRRDTPDLSSQRRRQDSPEMSLARGEVPNDSSPPRRSKTSAGSRVRNELQDLTPPGRRDSPDAASTRKAVFNDSSPPRKSRNSTVAADRNGSQDLSPPRKKPPRRMADGSIAGLTSDKDAVSAAERKRAAEAKSLAELDPSLSGRGAETVFRDKRGRRLEGLEEMMRQQRGGAKPAEEPLEWGKGLAQKKGADARLAELEEEKSKPFARYRDDAELDKSFRERVRWGDPMAHLVKQNISEPVLEDLGAREEMKASGFIIPQNVPKHSWLKTGAAPPPNRYNIKPGRHWDGVDRSTGYEQGMFKQQNEKKARDLEAYLWSVSDM